MVFNRVSKWQWSILMSLVDTYVTPGIDLNEMSISTGKLNRQKCSKILYPILNHVNIDIIDLLSSDVAYHLPFKYNWVFCSVVHYENKAI